MDITTINPMLHCYKTAYINDGTGNFTKSKDAFFAMQESKSCVRASNVNVYVFMIFFVGEQYGASKEHVTEVT